MLAPEDVIADKTLALWGRAEARDLIDVDALATRFGPDQLLRLAAAKDPGFDPALMPAAITTAANRDPAVYASLGVTGPALDQLRTRAHTWAAQLTSQHTAAAEPTARELAADCFPAPPQQATQRPGQADRAAEPSPPPHIRRSPGQDRDHGR